MTEHETITIKLLKENKGNYIQLGPVLMVIPLWS